jgi:hypothetical protein
MFRWFKSESSSKGEEQSFQEFLASLQPTPPRPQPDWDARWIALEEKTWRDTGRALAEENLPKLKSKAQAILTEQRLRYRNSKPRFSLVTKRTRECSTSLYYDELTDKKTVVLWQQSMMIAKKMTGEVLHFDAAAKLWERRRKHLIKKLHDAIPSRAGLIIVAALAALAIIPTILDESPTAHKVGHFVGNIVDAVLVLAGSAFITFFATSLVMLVLTWLVEKMKGPNDDSLIWRALGKVAYTIFFVTWGAWVLAAWFW